MTELEIETAEPLNSATTKEGDTFRLKLSEPLVLNRKLLLPAGLQGTGEVIHAARSGWSGKGGELILAARSLNFQSLELPLRSFRINAAAPQVRGSVIVAGVGVFSTIHAAEIVVTAGTRAKAKLARDVSIPC